MVCAIKIKTGSDHVYANEHHYIISVQQWQIHGMVQNYSELSGQKVPNH